MEIANARIRIGQALSVLATLRRKRYSSNVPLIEKSNLGPLAAYEELIKLNKISPDKHQIETVNILQNLYESIKSYDPEPPSAKLLRTKMSVKFGNDKGRDKLLSPDFQWIQDNEKTAFEKIAGFFSLNNEKKEAYQYGPRGLYIYGSVGTGKTMTMDLFYNTVPIQRKRRVHFHALMQDVHSRVHQLKTKHGYSYDPIPVIAAALAKDAWLLCFDEFQVTDIADAMILRHLFEGLFKQGVVLVTTSNRHPDELYKNGIQRKSFLPAIENIKKRCIVHCLDSGVDYRRRAQEHVGVFFNAGDPRTRGKLETIFKVISENQPRHRKVIPFLGRKLSIDNVSGRICMASFTDLCCNPLGAADYIKLTSNFDLIILTNVPQMSMENRNEARRFITLIDELYDNKIKLIASFDSPLHELFNGDNSQKIMYDDRILFDDLRLKTDQLKSSIFTGEEEVFAFKRVVSRLVEMQELKWIGVELANKIRKIIQ